MDYESAEPGVRSPISAKRAVGLTDTSSLVPNIGTADEISQETNLRLWEQFDQFDPSRDFLSWACTIAYYQVLKYRKMTSRERVHFDSKVLDLLSDETARRRDELAAKQSYLIDCLAQLSDFKREVFRLYYSLGMTAKAVAEKLGRVHLPWNKCLCERVAPFMTVLNGPCIGRSVYDRHPFRKICTA